jgi:acyl-homoserine-lactone acylase
MLLNPRSMRAFSFAVLAASSFLLPLAAAQWGPAEPWRDAVLYRDEWGTPHVYARNLSSMAYAFGYAQAADHPEALLRAYRVANGRAAEVWGEDWADSDAFALMLGHAALARQTFPNTDSATQDLCAGFAAGANAWYEEHPQAVPEWAEPVRPEDPLALMHCYLMSFAPFDLPDAYFRRRPAVSGNAWAVAPSKTESGETMLVMNPHGYYDSPFVWYEAHIGSNLTRDDWSVSGATLVGLPVLMMGHNGDLGWALTPNAADSADVYLPPPEASDQGNPNAVGGPQHSLDTALLRELQIVNSQRTYRVRTNRGFEERRVVYYDNGGHPTITTADGEYYTWNIGGYHDFGTIQQLHWMARSSNLAEFQNALELHQLSAFHVTYADISGNLLYFYSAKVGDKGDLDGLRIRNQSEPPSWNKPLPIEMRFLWRGVVPVTQLPSIENPISGYLQACGNPPWTATEDVDFQWDSFPAWFGSEADTYRARRVRQLLSGGGISYRDMQDMLFDVLVPFGMTAVPRILEAAATDGNWRGDTRSESHELIDVLRNWNYAADIRSEGMTAFQVWWTAFLSLAPYGMPEEATLEALVANTPEIQSRSLEAIDQAARLMLREFGTVRVPWGDAHVIRRGNETHPIGGSATGFPIFVVSDWEFGAKAWEADYGYGYAAAVRFGEFTESVSVLPFGVSSNSKSPHYADQLDLFRSGRLKPAWFYKDEVLPNVASARGRAFEMVARGMDATFEVNAMHPVEARIDTALRPPASVPGSLSAYSIFAEFSYNPPDAKITLEATLRASKEVRGGRPLDAFSVFAFNGQRWQPVRAQEIVAEEDAIHVSLEEPAVFALFGPARPGAARPTPKPKPAPQEPAANETVAAAPIPDWPGRGARSGAISWGRTVDLRPPAMDGVFQLKSDIEIGARLTTAPNPPRPLPEGLVAFTPYVLAELSNPDVAVTIEVDLRPTPGEVKPEDLSQLSIYACDETSAWERVSNQQFEPDVPRFAGTDTRPRIYVVLGPTGAKTSRPAEE